MRYTVEVAFGGYQVGDVIVLGERRAKYLLMYGLISSHTLRLLDEVTAITTGTITQTNAEAYQATISGTGAVSATVIIQYSNNGTKWINGGTINVSGTDLATDGFADDESWTYTRAKLTAISGTGAKVTVTMGK